MAQGSENLGFFIDTGPSDPTAGGKQISNHLEHVALLSCTAKVLDPRILKSGVSDPPSLDLKIII
jgi:hypothetical protein